MRQISINQTSVSDPIRFPEDPLVSIDRRSKGIIKFIYSEDKDRLLLSFSDYSGKSVTQRIFNDMPAFKIYLSTREDVNTWEVRIEAKDDSLQSKLAYFHREPFGDIERFSFERDLNRILSLEGGGRWITEYVGCSATDLKRVGMIDQSTWWQTIFTTFNTETSFQKANQTHEQEYASWRRTLGWGMLSLLIGGIFSPFLNKQLQQDDNKDNVETANISEVGSPNAHESTILGSTTSSFSLSLGESLQQVALVYGLSMHIGNSKAAARIGLFSLFTNFLSKASAQIVNQSNTTFFEFIERYNSGNVSYDSYSTDMIPLPDDSILLTDDSWFLTRLANNGSLINVKRITAKDSNFLLGGFSIFTMVSDGNIVGLGTFNSSKVAVVKSTIDGKLLWSRTFEINSNCTFHDNTDFSGSSAITATSDNGVAFMRECLFPSHKNSAVVAKLTSQGLLSWSYILDTTPWTNNFFLSGFDRIASSRKGDVVIARANVRSAPPTYTFVAKFSSNGALLWNTQFRDNYLDDIAVTKDGSIYVEMSNYHTSIIKWSSNGTYDWSQTYFQYKPYGGLGEAIKTFNDDLYVIGGVDGSVLLMKWLNNGTVSWVSNLTYRQGTYTESLGSGTSITVNSNGLFASGGFRSEVGSWLAKLSLTGKLSNCSYIENFSPSDWELRPIAVNFIPANFTISAVQLKMEDISKDVAVEEVIFIKGDPIGVPICSSSDSFSSPSVSSGLFSERARKNQPRENGDAAYHEEEIALKQKIGH